MSLIYAEGSGGSQVSVEDCPFCDLPITPEGRIFSQHVRYRCPDAPREATR